MFQIHCCYEHRKCTAAGKEAHRIRRLCTTVAVRFHGAGVHGFMDGQL